MEGADNKKAAYGDLSDQNYRSDEYGGLTGAGLNRFDSGGSLTSSYDRLSMNSYSDYGRQSYGGYGGYNSGYNSYGGQSGYGMYSSYNRGRMGNNGYTSPSQMRGQEGMDPNRPMQRPPITFREDVWGFLNGAHSILNVFYAGSGMLAFGSTFLRTSLNVARFLSHKSLGLLLRLTGIHYFKKLMQFTKNNNNADWATELSSESAMGDAWSEKTSGFGFKKFFQILRLLALAGALLSWVMKKREQRKMAQYMQMRKAVEEKIAKINEQIQIHQIENIDEELLQDPAAILSENESQVLDQAYEAAKEQLVTIEEEAEEIIKAAEESNVEQTEIITVSEPEKIEATTNQPEEEAILASESSEAKIVEETIELQEVQTKTESITEQEQNTHEVIAETIESENVPASTEVNNQAAVQENATNCHSEEFWKTKVQSESFFNQVESSTISQPTVVSIESEDPFFPSMLRQSSVKPKETSKALPWLKRSKTSAAQ